MPEEYSKEKLIEIFETFSKDGMISHDKIAELVHDARFPDSLFANAVEKLKEREADDKRQRELAAIVIPRIQEVKALLSRAAASLREGDRNGYDEAEAKASAILLEIEPEARELEAVSARLNSK
jgi:hypothetical protein